MVHANDETPFAKHRGGDHWYAPLPINTGALCSLLFALCSLLSALCSLPYTFAHKCLSHLLHAISTKLLKIRNLN